MDDAEVCEARTSMVKDGPFEGGVGYSYSPSIHPSTYLQNTSPLRSFQRIETSHSERPVTVTKVAGVPSQVKAKPSLGKVRVSVTNRIPLSHRDLRQGALAE